MIMSDKAGPAEPKNVNFTWSLTLNFCWGQHKMKNTSKFWFLGSAPSRNG